MKNALEGSNSRKTKGEEQISDLTDRMVEITVMEQKKRMKRNEDSQFERLRDIKSTNMHMIGVPEVDQKEKGLENIFEDVLTKKVLNMRKETLRCRKHRVPSKINPRGNTLRHILLKLTKLEDKGKILKTTKEK